MATRKRTKKYNLSNLVNNFKLVDLFEDELIDDNDSEFENASTLLLICNQQLQQTPVMILFSLWQY